MSGGTSSQESLTKLPKWNRVKTNQKVDFFEKMVEKGKIKVETSSLNDYIFVPKKSKPKFVVGFLIRKCTQLFTVMSKDPKSIGGLNLSE